ncbi:MAG: HlyD family efflux transporter periplasmic adaptor subunit [Eubacterium sp.]|nr:HlyD family efflux transporter periplasmic adaptor subunit [Eubacterium sp.]
MKKIIITLSIIAVLVAGGIVGVKIYKNHRKNSNPVKCMPVNMLNTGYWGGESETMSGSITATGDQKIYAEMSSVISDIYVSEGDTVKVGDPILKFDMTQKELEIETMRTQLEVYRSDVKLSERQLEKLKQIVPIEDKPTTTEATTELTTEETSEKTTENTTEDATPTDPGTEGSTDDSTEDTTENTTEIDPDWIMYPDGTWGPPDAFDDDNFDDPDDPNEEQEYTREDLAKAIREKENLIVSQRIKAEMYELDLVKAEKALDNAEIKAKINGIVKKIDTSGENIGMGNPIITISAESGYQTIVSVNEWKLSSMNIGDAVMIYSYENGMSYTGKVAEVSNTPADDYYNYSGNTASYYPVTIVVDEPCEGLNEYMYVEVSMDMSGNNWPGGMSDDIYLQLSYLRQEHGNYYVLKNENGRLKKQYVKTGKIVYGSVIEIKSGIEMNDYICFPYGKDVAEGKKCINTESYEDVYGY